MAVLAVWNSYNSLYGTLSSFSGIIDHRGAQLLVLSASIVLGLASAYFFYLAVLKTKAARSSPLIARTKSSCFQQVPARWLQRFKLPTLSGF